MKRPNGLSENTVQYFIKKPEQVKISIENCKRNNFKTALEQWLYIEWRIKHSLKEKVIFT